MSKNKDNFIDLSNLPMYYKGIDWRNSVGCILKFKYNNIDGELKIVKYISDHTMLVQYKDWSLPIQKSSIYKCMLASVLKIRDITFKFKKGDKVNVFSGEIEILKQKNNNPKTYVCKCMVCNSTFDKIESLIINNSGCPVCANKKVEIGINDMWTTAPELAELLHNKDDGYKYTKLSAKKVNWECPICGEIIYDKIISNIYKQGLACPVCGKSKSYPNRFMYALLKSLNINFKDEKVFSWSDNKKYDFYLNNHNTIIEMHGKQHYDEDIYDETYQSVQANDKYKQRLALSNGISNYIVIDARYSNLEWIKNSILNSNLANLIDLSKVDWLEVERVAQVNLLKEACRLWDEGERDIKEIADQIGCHFSTTSRFLRKGEQIGITKYTVEESNKLGAKRQSDACYQNSGKPFKCIETNQIFGSNTYAMKISKEILGKYIEHRTFKKVCDGNQLHANNLHFQYITRSKFNTIKSQSPELAFGDFFISTEEPTQKQKATNNKQHNKERMT